MRRRLHTLSENSWTVARFRWFWYRIPGVLHFALRRERKRVEAVLRAAVPYLHPDDVDHWIKLKAHQRLGEFIDEGNDS